MVVPLPCTEFELVLVPEYYATKHAKYKKMAKFSDFYYIPKHDNLPLKSFVTLKVRNVGLQIISIS